MNYPGLNIAYIFNRFFFRIYYFLYHWYVRGFRKFSNWTLDYLEKLDYTFALKINLKNIFQPLYQDYSFVGHIIGFVLRSIRIISAVIIYTLISVICLALFLAWAAIPPFAVYQIITNFPN
jgi:hypothetical protein